jgi:hypothetical protein
MHLTGLSVIFVAENGAGPGDAWEAGRNALNDYGRRLMSGVATRD